MVIDLGKSMAGSIPFEVFITPPASLSPSSRIAHAWRENKTASFVRGGG